MAGFFGLFNYSKEGPGIAKDAPQKKTYVVFIETFFRNFWKFIPMNLVYFLISIPVITGGLASAGLTNVTRNIARDRHSFGLSDFFETIKKNFKQSLLAGIINTVIYAILFFDLYFFYFLAKSTVSIIGLVVCCVMLFIFILMNYYIWTLIITFNFTLSQVYKNSFRFVFINMKKNFLCFLCLTVFYVLLLAIIYFTSVNILVSTLELLFIICCVPAFRFLMIQYFVFPSIKKYVIDPYYEEHPDEDIEKRRDLGIEVPEDEEDSEEDDIVFED